MVGGNSWLLFQYNLLFWVLFFVLFVEVSLMLFRSPSWPVWNPRLAPLPCTPSTTPPSPPKSPQRLSPTKVMGNGRYRGHHSPLAHRNTPPSPLLLSTPQRPAQGTNFRFPPWSGPSPRAASSPTIPSPLLPLASPLPIESTNQR